MGRGEEAGPLGAVTRIWIAVAAVACGAAVLVIVLARSGDTNAVAAPTAPVTVRTSLDRNAVEFGDPVTAEVLVLLDRNVVRSDDVRISAGLGPLTPLGPATISRTARGPLLAVAYTVRANCMDERCLDTRRPLRIVLPPARVEIPGTQPRTASWPVLLVRGRVSPADVAQQRPPLRSDATPPPVSWRIAPGSLALALEIAAVVLAVGAVLLGGWTATAFYRERRRNVLAVTGLERALALAREAERRPEPDRRRALGLLARLLGARDTTLADTADDLAWSAPPPSTGALSDFVAQVERRVEGGEA
jgi:hypothetical protein